MASFLSAPYCTEKNKHTWMLPLEYKNRDIIFWFGSHAPKCPKAFFPWKNQESAQCLLSSVECVALNCLLVLASYYDWNLMDTLFEHIFQWLILKDFIWRNHHLGKTMKIWEHCLWDVSSVSLRKKGAEKCRIPAVNPPQRKCGKTTCKCVSVPFMVQHTENCRRAVVSDTLFPANQ